MKRLDLVKKIIERKKQLGISIENLALLSGISVRTVNRVLQNKDVKLSTIEALTNFLGLDFAGKEVISFKKLQKQRAHEKAIFLASIVQGNSALEMQGLEDDSIKNIISMYEKELLYGTYKKTLWVA